MNYDHFVIDSNIFIAFYIEADIQHQEAVNLLSELNTKNLIIHPYVIQETATVLAYKIGPYAAFLFLDDIYKASNITIPQVDIFIDIGNFKKLKQKISFTDATLIYLAKNLNAGLITFDKQMIAASKK